MTKFFSPSTGGFYTDEIHGARNIPDPSASAPMISVYDPDWVAPDDDPKAVAPKISTPDPDWVAPHVDNPDCIIPADAVEITDETHAALLAAQSSGKVIAADKKGKVRDAKRALDASDMVALRCLKAGVSFPAEWQAYCATLRTIVGGSSDDIPTAPDYPAGT